MARKKVIHEEFEEGVKEENDLTTDLIVKDLKEKLGDVAYVLGRGDSPPEVNEWLSTGSTILDSILSNNPECDGGIPIGRLVEIYGEEATGKSFIAYMILKDCQRKGGIPVLIDTENSANLQFLRMIGLDPTKNMIYIQVDTVEEVFSAIERVVIKIREEDKNRLCAIVWDSVAATTTGSELEGDYGQATVALAPRLIGQGLRKIGRFIGKQRIALVFLNQVRMKIGVAFGNPFTTPGGKAIPFHASARVQLLTAGKLKAGNKDIIGAGIKAKVVKNRMGPPHRECVLTMYFDKGIVDEEGWIPYLEACKVLKKINAQKSSIEFGGETIEFKNKDFINTMENNPELKEYCRKEIKKSLYVEQNPDERPEDEEIVMEALAEDEQI